MKNLLITVAILCMLSCSRKESRDGVQVLQQASPQHDPQQVWTETRVALHIQEPRLLNPHRYSVLTLDNGTVFDQQATSRRKGPLPNKPKKKSDGGLFTPSKHLDKNGDGRIMDTDAEYKLFDDMAQKLLELPEEERKGSLDLFTEMSMCDSCKDIKKQFEEMFPKINVNVSYKKVFQ